MLLLTQNFCPLWNSLFCLPGMSPSLPTRPRLLVMLKNFEPPVTLLLSAPKSRTPLPKSSLYRGLQFVSSFLAVLIELFTPEDWESLLVVFTASRLSLPVHPVGYTTAHILAALYGSWLPFLRHLTQLPLSLLTCYWHPLKVLPKRRAHLNPWI